MARWLPALTLRRRTHTAARSRVETRWEQTGRHTPARGDARLQRLASAAGAGAPGPGPGPTFGAGRWARGRPRSPAHLGRVAAAEGEPEPSRSSGGRGPFKEPRCGNRSPQSGGAAVEPRPLLSRRPEPAASPAPASISRCSAWRLPSARPDDPSPVAAAAPSRPGPGPGTGDAGGRGWEGAAGSPSTAGALPAPHPGLAPQGRAGSPEGGGRAAPAGAGGAASSRPAGASAVPGPRRPALRAAPARRPSGAASGSGLQRVGAVFVLRGTRSL